MSLTLILMRHAKSSWDSLELSDHDRPLNSRGRASAQALGNWMRAEALLPDEVLSSSSRRTQETLEGLGLSITPTYTRALYHAEPRQMWQQLQIASGATVLMIGHNPGIGAFAHELVAQDPDHERFWDYPTGATLVVRFDAAHWAEVQPQTGQAMHFVIPRELMA